MAAASFHSDSTATPGAVQPRLCVGQLGQRLREDFCLCLFFPADPLRQFPDRLWFQWCCCQFSRFPALRLPHSSNAGIFPMKSPPPECSGHCTAGRLYAWCQFYAHQPVTPTVPQVWPCIPDTRYIEQLYLYQQRPFHILLCTLVRVYWLARNQPLIGRYCGCRCRCLPVYF